MYLSITFYFSAQTEKETLEHFFFFLDSCNSLEYHSSVNGMTKMAFTVDVDITKQNKKYSLKHLATYRQCH